MGSGLSGSAPSNVHGAYEGPILSVHLQTKSHGHRTSGRNTPRTFVPGIRARDDGAHNPGVTHRAPRMVPRCVLDFVISSELIFC